jgi:hypothetical protein
VGFWTLSHRDSGDSLSFRVERNAVPGGITVIVLTGDPSIAEWQAALHESAVWLNDLEQRGLHTSLVIDPTALQVPGAAARRMFGEWRALHMPLITNVCRCAAYVAASPVMRGVLVAVFWIARPVIPVEIAASRDQALAWARRFEERDGAG